jgi:hypothetical protein
VVGDTTDVTAKMRLYVPCAQNRKPITRGRVVMRPRLLIDVYALILNELKWFLNPHQLNLNFNQLRQFHML